MSDIKPKSTAVTEARRAAARTNGAKSKGPVTPEGKARSAGNAVTHGLTSTDHLFLTESKEDYKLLLAAYRAEYDPQGQTENDLVEHLTKSKWFQDRAYEMIAALIEVDPIGWTVLR